MVGEAPPPKKVFFNFPPPPPTKYLLKMADLVKIFLEDKGFVVSQR